MEKSNEDRRRHPRHKPKSGAYAIIPSHYKIGPLHDISEGGFSFKLGPAAETEHFSSKMDLISDDGNFRIEKMPCKTVSWLPMDDPTSKSLTKSIRFCMQFGKLMDDQSSKLTYYIENYTST